MSNEAKSLEALLTVGAKAVVATQPDNPDGPRMVVTLRGWQRNQFLVLDCSANEKNSGVVQARSRRLSILPKSHVIIRFIIEGEVLAFRELVTETFYIKDIPHFAIRWPANYESMQVRKFERFEVETRCKIVLGTGDAVMAATTDLSLGGCGVRLSHPLERGANVTIGLTLPDGTRLDGIPAAIRAVSESADGYLAGLQFAEVPDQAHRDLEFFLHTLRMFRLLETDQSQNQLMLLTGAGKDGALLNRMTIPNHQIAVLTDVVECFYRLRMLRPKALLLDCRQEGWSGMDVCAFIRANPHLKDVRIILIGIAAQHIDAATRLLGADACIPDTVTSADRIAEIVEETLRGAAPATLHDLGRIPAAIRA